MRLEEGGYGGGSEAREMAVVAGGSDAVCVPSHVDHNTVPNASSERDQTGVGTVTNNGRIEGEENRDAESLTLRRS
jgi:hypothetical protein